MGAFSFFEADQQYKDKILQLANGADYEGKRIKVEATSGRNQQQQKKRSNRPNRKSGR
jgi:hypothetical protein